MVEVIYPAQPTQAGALTMPAQAADDQEVIRLWLHGRPAPTVRAYGHDVAALRAFAGCGVRGWTLAHLQQFASSRAHLAPSSVARSLSAIKSLLSFAQRVGYVQYNIGAALTLPKLENRRGERIVTERAIQRLLILTPDGRDGLIVRLFYYGGLRCEEVAGLRWRHIQAGKAGATVVQVYGKGRTSRYVLLNSETAQALASWRGDQAGPDDPLFRCTRGKNAGGPLSTTQLWRIVKQAAATAGLPAHFSPHWLRHAHASHALDRGAPISLVQQTLGHASVQTTGQYLHARPDASSSTYLL